MILADTSAWVNHLRRGDSRLAALLLDGDVIAHPYVLGELACGNLTNRREVLSLLHELPLLDPVDPAEFTAFLDQQRLWGIGLGFVDVHLLASARLSGVRIWTADVALRKAALRLGLSS